MISQKGIQVIAPKKIIQMIEVWDVPRFHSMSWAEMRRQKIIKQAQLRIATINLIIAVALRIVGFILSFPAALAIGIMLLKNGFNAIISGLISGELIILIWFFVWAVTAEINTNAENVSIKRRKR